MRWLCTAAFALTSLTACHDFVTLTTVSTQELIANPNAFDGQRVRLRGHVSYGFENCAVDRVIWYWPSGSCYDEASALKGWEGDGYVIGTVSMSNHGHLGLFRFSLVNAIPVQGKK